MSVLDTSAVVDMLLGTGHAPRLADILNSERSAAAPDVVIFETLAVLRRLAARGDMSAERADAAVEDLSLLPLQLYPSLPLRARAWALRRNLTVADALFVALAESLGERLVTSDASLVRGTQQVSAARVDLLS